MDVRKGGCPAPGFSGRMHDNATFNRIMLKFRPIAPKPPTDGSVSDSMSASSNSNGAPLTKRNRPKRKYVRANHKRINNNNNSSNSGTSGRNRKCKTAKEEEKRDLQSDGTVVSSDFAGSTVVPDTGSTMSMSFGLPISTNMGGGKFGSNDNSGPGLEDRSDRAVESWVVVNGMTTETLLELGELGRTDGEKIRNLERDTCPGMISDGLYRVQWVNLAYKRMVEGVGCGEPPAEVVVWLALEENIPVGWPVFACTVRVVYTCRKEKHSKTMPCDVWRMDFGGFAWRLDAKAELCLGR